MGSDAGVSGTEWSKKLYREYRAAMPPDVRQARDVFVARNQWDVVAAGVLDWAMANRLLTAENKVKALTFAQQACSAGAAPTTSSGSAPTDHRSGR